MTRVPRSLLFVITTLDRGGAETQVVHLARGFVARGWRVEVAALLGGGAFAGGLVDDGIPVRELGLARGVPHPVGVFRLAGIVRSSRPTVVHGQMVHANLLSRATRLLAPMPVLVNTAQNIDEEGRWREAAYRLTDPLCDVTTNVSEAATTRYRALRLVADRKLEYVPNGIDLDRFVPNPEARTRVRRELGLGEQFLWLAVGRLDVQKDPLLLIDAFARHAARQAGARLAIAGVGPLQSQCEARVREHGLDSTVHMLGARDDVPDLMAAADALVLTSRWEGLPMVLLEASAAGLPIVATAAAGTTELIRDGETGLLAPVGDRDGVTDRLDRMGALTPIERRGLADAALRQVAGDYSMPSVLDRWERLYATRLAQRGFDLESA
jgi:glycosyltransferase involved in cell wall biosynthesis